MNVRLLVAAVAASLALTACKPQAPAPAATESPGATVALESAADAAVNAAPTPATTATPAEATALTVTTLAGSYSGTLPCADCSGIDTHIVFAADGTYQQTDTYQGKKDGQFSSHGTWTLSDDGKTVQLVESGADGAKLAYGVTGSTQITALDRDGKPVQSELNYSLTRDK